MDSLFYFLNFLRFRPPDRLELTLRICSFIILTLTLIYLICSFIAGYWLDFNLSTVRYILRSAPELIFVAIFVGLLLLLTILLSYFCDILRWIKTPYSFTFEPEDCLNNIEFQGKIQNRDKGFAITSSGSGMLFKHYWRDFEVKLKFRFEGEGKTALKTSYEKTKLQDEYITANNFLGFIFRARDFDNYFMLSMGTKKFIERVKCVSKENLVKREYLLITPHIRVGGAWDVFTENKFSLPVRNFSVAGDNNLIIRVERSILKLWIEKLNEQKNKKGKKVMGVPFFTWHLPTHYLVNWGREKEIDSHSPGDSSKIPFRNSIGRIGFRAYGDEKFLIRNITIKKLLAI